MSTDFKSTNFFVLHVRKSYLKKCIFWWKQIFFKGDTRRAFSDCNETEVNLNVSVKYPEVGDFKSRVIYLSQQFVDWEYDADHETMSDMS